MKLLWSKTGGAYYAVVRRVSFLWKPLFAIFIYPFVIEWIIWRPFYTVFLAPALHLNPSTPLLYLAFYFRFDVPAAVRFDLWATVMLSGLGFMIYGWVGLPEDGLSSSGLDVNRWRLFFIGLGLCAVAALFPATYWPY